jgi:hypothetical protein
MVYSPEKLIRDELLLIAVIFLSEKIQTRRQLSLVEQHMKVNLF